MDDYAREPLPDQVARYVRELILTGSVEAGEFLRLEPIAEALKVSNTPVREGLLTLKNEGLLRLLPRRGFVVEPFSHEDVRDLYWTQAQLTGELAARAAERITPEGLRTIEVLLDELDAMSAPDRNAMAEHGHDFHRHINLAASSRRLAFLAGTIASHLPLRIDAAIEAQSSGLAREHRAIFNALVEHDADGARRLMSEHVRADGERLIAALERGELRSHVNTVS